MVKLGAEIHGRTNTHKGGGLRNNGYESSNAQQSRLTLIIRARRDWSSQSSKIVKANDRCPTATFFISLRSLRNCYVLGSFLAEGSSHRASSSLRGKQFDLLPIFSRILHCSPANLFTYAGYNFKERIPSTTGVQCLHSSSVM